jgi:hypothetical protein
MTGDLQGADHLDVALAGLWFCVRCTGRDGAGGSFSVQRVALVLPPAGAAVGSIDLHEPVAPRAQKSHQAGAPAAAALDAEGVDAAELDRPCL